MNNKGFAITGILYTLFVLFIMILLSILSTVSYKKGILEKTVLGLEDDFSLTEIKTEDIVTTYNVNATSNEIKTTLNGKYVFTLYNKIGTETTTTLCSVYLDKNQIIPNKIEKNNTNPDFTLIPNDCNELAAEVTLDTTSKDLNKLILTKVYKFKDSD